MKETEIGNTSPWAMLRKVIFIIAIFIVIAAMIWLFIPAAPSEPTSAVNDTLHEVTVYKSATCSCCNDWITHLEQAGFKVTSHNRDDMDRVKASFGVKPGLASCHTALVGGYVIEGHVPAVDIIKLLQDKPQIIGLTAPGMPKYSPGMQASGQKPRGYDVLTFDKTDNTTVFKHY